MTFKSPTQPLCRWCGTPIKKRTARVYLRKAIDPKYDRNSMLSRYIPVGDNWPKDKADCQKLTNHQVTSVSYSPLKDANFNVVGKKIDQFGEWDGESYDDEFFCTGAHARLMGYGAAVGGWSTKDYREARDASKKGEAA